MRLRACAVALVVPLLLVGLAADVGVAQVELDRLVSRVDGRPIMQSDVRQARALHLVDDSSSDASTLRALENRWLMLNEIGRAAPIEPVSDQALAERIAAWRNSTDVDAASAPLPMAESDIAAWFRDDLRIGAYLDRRFGMLPEANRAQAERDWIARLRQRAELD